MKIKSWNLKWADALVKISQQLKPELFSTFPLFQNNRLSIPASHYYIFWLLETHPNARLLPQGKTRMQSNLPDLPAAYVSQMIYEITFLLSKKLNGIVLFNDDAEWWSMITSSITHCKSVFTKPILFGKFGKHTNLLIVTKHR